MPRQDEFYDDDSTKPLTEKPPEQVDFVTETKQARKDLDTVLQKLKSSPRDGEERNAAAHYIKNAIMWLGLDLKALAEPNPYPESYNPASPKIEPTADGLKL